MLLALFLACPGPGSTDSADPDDSTGDSGDSGDAATPPMDASHLVVDGLAGSATGFAVAMGPDTDGDRGAAAWIAGDYVHQVCRFEGQSGHLTLPDGAACIHSANLDYPGYGLGVGAEWVGLGAIGGAAGGTYTGRVYLLAQDIAPGLHEVDEAAVTLEGESAGDYAGTTVAFLGGGGADSVVVGAPGNDAGGAGAGAGRAYLWPEGVGLLSGSVAEAPLIIQGTSPPSALKHGAPEAGDGVGSVAANAGDLDGDGLDDLVLGCNGADDGGANAGLAAVFRAPLPSGVGELRDADVVILGVSEGQLFGDSAAGLGDTDGDGLGDLAVAGEMAVNGRTWVFSGPAASGSPDAAFASFEGEVAGDNAGAALAGAGDVDGDGKADLLVGALLNSDGASAAGAAYLIHGPFSPGAHSLRDADTRWVGLADGDSLGRAVAGGRDYDGDGLDDVLLGAPYSDAGGAFGGAAYVVTGE